MSDIEAAFATIIADKIILNALIHGGASTTVETDSGTHPSIRKAVEDKLAAILGEHYLRADVNGIMSSAAGAEMLILKDLGGSGAAANPYLSFKDAANLRIGKLGLISGSNNDLYLRSDVANVQIGATAGDILITPNNAIRARFSLALATLSSDVAIEEVSGGEMMKLKDAGGAGSVANPYMGFRDSNDIRLGYFGYSSTGNSTLSIRNEVSGANVRVDAPNIFEIYTGSSLARRAYFDTERLVLEGDGGETLQVKDTDSAGNAATPQTYFRDSLNNSLGYIGFGSSGNSDMYASSDQGGMRWYVRDGLGGPQLQAMAINSKGNMSIYGEAADPYKLTLGSSGSTTHTYVNYKDVVGNTYRLLGWYNTGKYFVVEDSVGDTHQIAHAGNVSTLVEENPNTVVIADDAVATIPTPQVGGFVVITCQPHHTTSPEHHRSGLIWYSLDATPQCYLNDGWGPSASMDAVNTDVTGTTGVDSRVTISATSAGLKIENRAGGTRTFTYRFQ